MFKLSKKLIAISHIKSSNTDKLILLDKFLISNIPNSC